MSRYDRIKRREKLDEEERRQRQRAALDELRREFERLRAANPWIKDDKVVYTMQQQARLEASRRSYEDNVLGGFAVGLFKTLALVIGIALLFVLPQASIIELLLAVVVFAML